MVHRWIDVWHKRKKAYKTWRAWAKICKEKGEKKRSEEFITKFYQKGLLMRSIRHMKLFCQVAGNKMYRRRVEQRIQMEVMAMVEQKRNE